jgi:hypothetical protein
MPTKPCSHCGQQIPGFASNCGYCGAAQTKAAGAESTVAAAAPTPAPTPSPLPVAEPAPIVAPLAPLPRVELRIAPDAVAVRTSEDSGAIVTVVQPVASAVAETSTEARTTLLDQAGLQPSAEAAPPNPPDATPAAVTTAETASGTPAAGVAEVAAPRLLPQGRLPNGKLQPGAGIPDRLLWIPFSTLGQQRSLRRLALVAGLGLVALWFVPWSIGGSNGVVMSWDLLSDDSGYVSAGLVALYPLLAGVFLTGLALVPGLPAGLWAGLLLVGGLVPLLSGPAVPQTAIAAALFSSVSLALCGMAFMAVGTAFAARKRETIAGRVLLGLGLLTVLLGFVVPQTHLENRPLIAALFRDFGEVPNRQVPAVLWGLLGFFASLMGAVGFVRPTSASDRAAPVTRGLSWFYAIYVVVTPGVLALGGAAPAPVGAAGRGVLGIAVAAAKGSLVEAAYLLFLIAGCLLLGDLVESGIARVVARSASRRRAAQRESVFRAPSPILAPVLAPAALSAPAPTVLAAAAGPAPPSVSVVERRLTDLKGLLERGLITQDEYSSKRVQILADL